MNQITKERMNAFTPSTAGNVPTSKVAILISIKGARTLVSLFLLWFRLITITRVYVHFVDFKVRPVLAYFWGAESDTASIVPYLR